jgi:hypothetical protein
MKIIVSDDLVFGDQVLYQRIGDKARAAGDENCLVGYHAGPFP